jgi:galactitol-specific phosphotransferase system IIC component
LSRRKSPHPRLPGIDQRAAAALFSEERLQRRYAMTGGTFALGVVIGIVIFVVVGYKLGWVK